MRPGTTRFAEWGGEFRDGERETETLGLDADADVLEVADDRVDSARITESVLACDRTDAFADAAAVNASVRIYARGDVHTMWDGVELAKKTLADGDAGDRLAALRDFDA
ncbi:hypothetical protein [Halomicrococcus gelatinilyticus]|uniref:hypothetical protein n=1 Tax=Halomicrococcus gelatinilyticus TaxID=1702103 RepID=UPI002E161723